MAVYKQLLQGWKFKEADGDEWLDARVPGTVHTGLLHNNKIPDPFYGTNERDLQWIDKKDWEYASTFSVPKEIMNSDQVELVFKGLDTYADVFLNGEKVLTADNMFRTWRADIKGLIREKKNIIRAYFHSPIQRGLEKLAELRYELPATNDVSELGGIGHHKVSVFTRKAPYHFGWDWGPRFVTSGIWKEAYIEGWQEARITDVFIRQNNVSALLAQFTAAIEIEADRELSGILHLSTEDIQLEKTVTLTNGINHIELDLEIKNPKLWWTNGLGEQPLYQFTAAILKDNQTLNEKSVKVGIRSLRLVTDQDEHGHAFYFELNGVPVFAKGANHIPNDSFLTEVGNERYRYEILSARESHMNMLRVWGGGIYEDDSFYELCDECGILVWQDFIFACSMYPGDDAFIENVKVEAIENIKRLRNHPSLALFCGNNEMDTAWSEYDEKAGWGWKQQYTKEQREKIWHDYEAIFHKLLPEVIQHNAPGTDYWPSSPMQGLSGDVSQHATNQSTSGDIHYWGVWHNLEPFENYNVNVGRFMSEYGFQSFPEEKTVRTYADSDDMALESDVMLTHQKNGHGNRLIKEYMEKYFHVAKDFSAFLYISGVQQAEAMKIAIEAHRRKMPYTMGSLYWQMNDCWPAPSWSSMDYYGRWKALQYYAKRCFEESILSVDGRDDEVAIYAITDCLSGARGTLSVQLLDFMGETLKRWVEPIALNSSTSKIIWALPKKKLFLDHLPEQTFLYASFENADQVIDEKTYFFVPEKDIHLPNPNITVKKVTDEGECEWTLETDRLARHVWVKAEVDGIFTDNYFDLIPGKAKTISFMKKFPNHALFTKVDPGKITVNSMADYIK